MLQKLRRDFAKIAKIYWLADRDTEQKKNLANSKRWFLRSEKLEATGAVALCTQTHVRPARLFLQWNTRPVTHFSGTRAAIYFL